MNTKHVVQIAGLVMLGLGTIQVSEAMLEGVSDDASVQEKKPSRRKTSAEKLGNPTIFWTGRQRVAARAAEEKIAKSTITEAAVEDASPPRMRKRASTVMDDSDYSLGSSDMDEASDESLSDFEEARTPAPPRKRAKTLKQPKEHTRFVVQPNMPGGGLEEFKAFIAGDSPEKKHLRLQMFYDGIRAITPFKNSAQDYKCEGQAYTGHFFCLFGLDQIYKYINTPRTESWKVVCERLGISISRAAARFSITLTQRVMRALRNEWKHKPGFPEGKMSNRMEFLSVLSQALGQDGVDRQAVFVGELQAQGWTPEEISRIHPQLRTLPMPLAPPAAISALPPYTSSGWLTGQDMPANYPGYVAVRLNSHPLVLPQSDAPGHPHVPQPGISMTYSSRPVAQQGLPTVSRDGMPSRPRLPQQSAAEVLGIAVTYDARGPIVSIPAGLPTQDPSRPVYAGGPGGGAWAYGRPTPGMIPPTAYRGVGGSFGQTHVGRAHPTLSLSTTTTTTHTAQVGWQSSPTAPSTGVHWGSEPLESLFGMSPTT